MFQNSLKICRNVQNILINTKANIQTSASFKEKWDLFTAVLVERKPVICPELTEIEKEYKAYLSALEFEASLKNEFEINFEKEKLIDTEKKSLDDVDITVRQTCQDFLDAAKDELAKFKFADRVTKADKSNDVKSLNRKLDKHLVFVLSQKIGDKSFFILPQGKREDGETLRQCADRVLKEKCGDTIKAKIFGNAPCGFYKYKYPKELRNENAVGAKVFIYFARYTSGQIDDKKADFKWLDKQELDEVLPIPYKRSVLPILFD